MDAIIIQVRSVAVGAVMVEVGERERERERDRKEGIYGHCKN